MSASPVNRRRLPAALLLSSLSLWGCDEDGASPRRVIGTADLGDALRQDATSDGAGGSSELDLSTQPDRAEADVQTADATPLDGPGPDALPVDAQGDAAPIASCQNGLDDDGDGLTDYPADLGCMTSSDDSEDDPATLACGNALDDDGDGLIDLDDLGCASPGDPDESNTCGPMQSLRDVTGQRLIRGTTRDATALFDASCNRNLAAPEVIFLFTVPAGLASLSFDTRGSGFDTVLSVRRSCDDVLSEVGCSDDIGVNDRMSRVVLETPEAGDYFVIVDGFLDESGPFVLSVRADVADGESCPPDGAFATCREGASCVGDVCAPGPCINGLDDDGDGRVDYPEEPGCATPADLDEADPAVAPQCSNGNDDDFNGVVDFPDDPSCESAGDDSEEPPGDCKNGLDDDGDGLIDLEDPGCMGNPDWFFEWNTAACSDFQDNDLDGLVDYPNDPGCDRLEDPDESDPAVPPTCFNGLDDDENGLTDFPSDFAGCISAADATEADPCMDLVPLDITGVRETRGNLEGDANEFAARCVQGTSAERAFVWRVNDDRPLERLTLSTNGSRFDTVLYAREQCAPQVEPDLACDDFSGQGGTAQIILEALVPGTELWVFVDTHGSSVPGLFRLRAAAVVAENGSCEGGEPWSCGAGLTCREGLCLRAACANEVDDDLDGLIDYPAEPGCASPADDDEEDPAISAACSNGLDDDGDGRLDYPQDENCAAAGDAVEGPDCADDEDNDGDGTTDFDRDGDGRRDAAADDDCACATDPSEGFDMGCADACDNDGDGLTDLLDPGCVDVNDPDEFNLPACRDGRDNDGDGFFDYPDEPGCLEAADIDERDPPIAPTCANGLDDDGDGTADHASQSGGALSPDDGCQAASDSDERGPCDAVQPALPEGGIARGETVSGQDQHVSDCRGGASPERVFRATVPYAAHIVAHTEGSDYDTVLFIRRTCPARVCELPAPLPPLPDEPDLASVDAAPPSDLVSVDAALPDALADTLADATPDAEVQACVVASTEVACDDDNGAGATSRVEFDFPGGDLFVFVDGFAGQSGNFTLTFTASYRQGDQCGPEMHAYAQCLPGLRCADDGLGTPRCQP